MSLLPLAFPSFPASAMPHMMGSFQVAGLSPHWSSLGTFDVACLRAGQKNAPRTAGRASAALLSSEL
jgi:hypothetical protein